MPPDTARTIGRRLSFEGFVDQAGRPLDDERSGADRPWIVSPIYTRCPHTCSALTAGLREALEESGLAASEYRRLSFSFDPSETAETLQAFRERMHLPADWVTLRAEDGHSLTRLLDTMDFRTMQTPSGEFQHPNLVAVLTPDLELAGYVFGVKPSAADLARLVRRARTGVPATARWGTLFFFFAATGFLASTFVFVWLLVERRARGHGPGSRNAGTAA
jgi:cytochrome oxidase Cu insertion factor (SCO1/SenC/PrrC family)